MKEKYTRLPSYVEIIVSCCCCLFLFFVLPLCLSIANHSQTGVMEAMILGSILFPFVLIILSIMSMRANFEANDTQVKFSHLGIKKIIRYDDIEDMGLKLSNDEYNIRSRYVETLTIYTKKKTYVFYAKVYINYYKAAKDPAYLTKQFETSQFSQLKRFIESKMDTIQGGRSNV